MPESYWVPKLVHRIKTWLPSQDYGDSWTPDGPVLLDGSLERGGWENRYFIANALSLVGQRRGQMPVVFEGWRAYGKSLQLVARPLPSTGESRAPRSLRRQGFWHGLKYAVFSPITRCPCIMQTGSTWMLTCLSHCKRPWVGICGSRVTLTFIW